MFVLERISNNQTITEIHPEQLTSHLFFINTPHSHQKKFSEFSESQRLYDSEIMRSELGF